MHGMPNFWKIMLDQNWLLNANADTTTERQYSTSSWSSKCTCSNLILEGKVLKTTSPPQLKHLQDAMFNKLQHLIGSTLTTEVQRITCQITGNL